MAGAPTSRTALFALPPADPKAPLRSPSAAAPPTSFGHQFGGLPPHPVRRVGTAKARLDRPEQNLPDEQRQCGHAGPHRPRQVRRIRHSQRPGQVHGSSHRRVHPASPAERNMNAVTRYINGIYESMVHRGLHLEAIRLELASRGIARSRAQVRHDVDHLFPFEGYSANHPARRRCHLPRSNAS